MQTGKSFFRNSRLRDSGSKMIFDDPILCAQFLRDYVDIPILKDIRPEDIEDVSERFVPLIGEERNADTVKRINLYGRTPVYLISLIEHKTEVDYNVSMQIFRYMVYIWEDYEKEMERAYNRGISRTKNFKYPPVLPIVYYEGREEWGASPQLKDRILCSESLQEYIPNYSYYLVKLQDYSNQILLDKKDEISLIMLINKIQSREDVDKLREIPAEAFDDIIEDTPERLLDMIAMIFRTLLIQLNIPEQETEEMVGKVKVRKMGELFANADFDDIRQGWQKVKDARKKAERYEKEAEKAQERAANYQREAESYQKEAESYQKEAETYQREAENYQREAAGYQKEAQNYHKELEEYRQKYKSEAIRNRKREMRYQEQFIAKEHAEGRTRQAVKEELQKVFMLSDQDAENRLKRYWKQNG